MHVPASQLPPEEQTVPQAPQLFGSLCVFAQTPPHRVCPAAQGTTQTPAVHVAPGAQATPHAPQLPLSEDSFVQALPQSDCPVGHTHAPDTQDCAAGQTVPQLPQFFESV
jgi:hypothetical protein